MYLFNQFIAGILPIVPKPIVRKVSSRYIAGATLQDAVRTVRALNAKGAMGTVDVLGEFITSHEQAAKNTAYCCDVLRTLASENLNGNLSVKLTSIGLELDKSECEQNLRKILAVARENGERLVRLDMENSPFTASTIELYKTLRPEFPNVGLVLQAYLRRSVSDVEQILLDGAARGIRTNVRLCKGIYREASEIAFQSRREIQENYLLLLERLIAGGAYVGIATHDEVLIDGAKTLLKKYNRTNDSFEFQMLLGVREEMRDSLLREGYRLRVYVPFGADWYGYSLRRLKENPSMAGYIVKGMFGRN